MAAVLWEAGRKVRGVDYYQLLGVDRDVTSAELKSAYRLMARSMHPDVGGSANAFHLLQEAYETLADPARRADYDRTARSRTAKSPPRATGGWGLGEDPNYVPKPPKLRLDDIPWWDRVDPRARVRYLPALGPDRAPTLALACAWSLLLIAGLAAEFNTTLMATLLSLLVASGVLLVVLLRKHIRAHRVGRRFAADFGHRRVFGVVDVDYDLVQRLTAELCVKYLTRLPAVRVFHGLAWPDSDFDDVHHAVLCGQRLVLVESKSWLPGHYTIDGDGQLWRNGHPFRGGVTRLAEGVSRYADLLPGVEVRGVVLVYPSRAGEVTTVDADDALIAPMTPAQFVRDMGRWLAEDPVTVDRDAFTAVLDHVLD